MGSEELQVDGEDYALSVAHAFKLREQIFAELGPIVETTAQAARLLIGTLERGGKVLVVGNGGSAAQAQHFAAELVGRYKEDRGGLPAIALTTDTSTLTALANDFGYENVFSRQIEALGTRGDVLVALTTSGRSPNVQRAVEQARRSGMFVLALTGAAKTLLAGVVDAHVAIPSTDTALVQEVHGAVLHTLCELIDERGVDRRMVEGTFTEGRADLTPTLRDLHLLRDSWRAAGLRTVSTNGCFDLLHAGHVRSLADARALGDLLIVGLNSDQSVRRLKGSRRPVNSFANRRSTLLGLRSVSHVVEIEDDPCEFLGALCPDVHCKGSEYQDAADSEMPERAVVEQHGGRVHYLPMIEGLSTSALLGHVQPEPL